jgi:flagellar hook-associated protein 2
LSTSLEDLQATNKFRSFTASNQTTDAFSVTVDGDATVGSYSLAVTQTAKSDILMIGNAGSAASGFSSSTSTGAFTDGSVITFTVGTQTSTSSTGTITIDSSQSTNTLAQVSAGIDDIDGISSYVLFDGSEYFLVVQGDNTGASNAVFIDDSNDAFDKTAVATSGNMRVLTAAADAQAYINGVSISSDDNKLENIEGMVIDISSTTGTSSTDTVDISVALDTTAVSSNISTFVIAYNAVIEFINERLTFNEDTGATGSFVGDSSVRNIVNNLRSIIGESYTSINPTIDSLALMGITTKSTSDKDNGKLTFSTSTFLTVYSDFQSQVEELFSSTADNFSDTMIDALDSYIDPLTGILDTLDGALDDQKESLEDQVTRQESRIENFKARVRTSFEGMEALAGRLQGTSAFLTSFFAE